MLKQGMQQVGGISFSGTGFVTSMRNAFSEPYILGGFGLIVITIPMWLHVLARLPLSVASPMVSLGYVIAVVIGAIFFKESITPLRIVGLSMIILGVIAIARSQ